MYVCGLLLVSPSIFLFFLVGVDGTHDVDGTDDVQEGTHVLGPGLVCGAYEVCMRAFGCVWVRMGAYEMRMLCKR
jgi:hypothetical protein